MNHFHDPFFVSGITVTPMTRFPMPITAGHQWRVMIGADFYRHVGEGNRGDEKVIVGVQDRNAEGQNFSKRTVTETVPVSHSTRSSGQK